MKQKSKLALLIISRELHYSRQFTVGCLPFSLNTWGLSVFVKNIVIYIVVGFMAVERVLLFTFSMFV